MYLNIASGRAIVLETFRPTMELPNNNARGCICVDVLLLKYNFMLYFDNIYISDLIIDDIFDTKTWIVQLWKFH